MPVLTPRLTVSNARDAQQFYANTLSATVGQVVTTPDGMVVHAEVTVGDVTFSLTESPANRNPTELGDTPVVLNLTTDDPDAIQAAFVKHGGTVMYAVADQFYGQRSGRLVDPFGHQWMVSTTQEELSEAELNKRTAEWSNNG